MRRSSLQLLITLFSSVSLEMVQSVEIYYQLQERLYLDLLVLYLVSLLLLVVETNPIQFSSILLVRQQMLYLSRTTRIQIYSISLEGCNREFLFTLLLGSLQLESLQQRNTIGVLSLPLQLNYRKIGDQSIQTTRQYPRLQRTGDSFSESSTTFKLAVNTIQTEIHSLLENPVLLFRLLEQQVLQRSYFPKISISQLRFNTNLLVLLVLLPTRLASTSSVQTGSVRLLNTQSSVKKVQSPLASLLLMSRSLHSFQRDLVHSSLLVVRQNPAPRHTWLETTSLFLVLRTSTSLHISLVLVLERSVKEENLIRLTLVRSIFLMMSLVEPSLLLVTLSLRRIQILTMSLLFSSVQRMKIMD